MTSPENSSRLDQAALHISQGDESQYSELVRSLGDEQLNTILNQSPVLRTALLDGALKQKINQLTAEFTSKRFK